MKATAKIYLLLFVMGALLAAPSCKKDASTDGGRDLIVVLDTSRSMIGQGGKNIFPQVRESLKKFINEIQPGDSLTIVTFDEKTEVRPTIAVRDDNDREIVNSLLSSVKAEGMWTYTMGMLRDVFRLAEGFEKKNPERKQVIMMLTDGLDDPPPGRRKEKFNIRDAAKGYEGKEWYIYLVNFGDLKNNSRFKEVQDELRSTMTKNVELIEGGKGPAEAVEGVQQTIQRQRESERSFFETPWFFVLLIILVLIILLWLYKMYSKIKVAGSLENYNYTLLDPYVNVANLGRFHLREVKVGKSGADVHLRDFDFQKPFVIRAERSKGKIVCRLMLPEGVSAEFINRDAGEFLNDGDVFKVANYSFKFIAQQG